jgi:tetratricopeptide (TPR) repeat protein
MRKMAVCCALTWAGILPFCAQPPASPSVAASASQLPADVQAKLDKLQADLKAAQVSGNRDRKAIALNDIGLFYYGLGENQKALDFYNQARPLYSAVGDRDGEAATLDNIGAAYSGLGENQKALPLYNQALAIMRAVGDRGGEATTLNNIGNIYSDLGKKRRRWTSITRRCRLRPQFAIRFWKQLFFGP